MPKRCEKDLTSTSRKATKLPILLAIANLAITESNPQKRQAAWFSYSVTLVLQSLMIQKLINLRQSKKEEDYHL